MFQTFGFFFVPIFAFFSILLLRRFFDYAPLRRFFFRTFWHCSFFFEAFFAFRSLYLDLNIIRKIRFKSQTTSKLRAYARRKNEHSTQGAAYARRRRRRREHSRARSRIWRRRRQTGEHIKKRAYARSAART